MVNGALGIKTSREISGRFVERVRQVARDDGHGVSRVSGAGRDKHPGVRTVRSKHARRIAEREGKEVPGERQLVEREACTGLRGRRRVLNAELEAFGEATAGGCFARESDVGEVVGSRDDLPAGDDVQMVAELEVGDEGGGVARRVGDVVG